MFPLRSGDIYLPDAIRNPENTEHQIITTIVKAPCREGCCQSIGSGELVHPISTKSKIRFFIIKNFVIIFVFHQSRSPVSYCLTMNQLPGYKTKTKPSGDRPDSSSGQSPQHTPQNKHQLCVVWCNENIFMVFLYQYFVKFLRGNSAVKN